MKNVMTIYLAGVPASGKTTIFKKIRSRLMSDAETFEHGLCKGIRKGRFHMIGVFDGSTFEGTDRLSMAVIDDAISYIKRLQDEPGKSVVFLEGDRLFNERFIRETGASVILIDADEKLLSLRHAIRGDKQTDVFLKGRRTKIENMASKFGLRKVFNNTPRQSDIIAEFICTRATQWLNLGK